MSTARQSRQRPRRADAERNVAAILDAAIDALTDDPETSMSEIAHRAGVARATVYVHFPTREALIAAITERAFDQTAEVLRAADPGRGDPTEALARMLSAGWRVLGRYHALVAINTRLGPDHVRSIHRPAMHLIRPLFKRGQADGAFNPDLSLDWMQTVLLELVHAASREVAAGRLSESKAERALIDTVIGALSPRPQSPEPPESRTSRAQR